MPSPDNRPPNAVATASELSQKILNGLILQRHVRIHPLQLTVLSLKLFHALQIRRFHTAVFAFPPLIRGVTYTELSADVFNLPARFGFLQDRYNLCLCKSRFTHNVSSIK